MYYIKVNLESVWYWLTGLFFSFGLFFFLRSFARRLFLLQYIIAWACGFTASTPRHLHPCTHWHSHCQPSWHVLVSNQPVASVRSRTFSGVRHSMSYWPGCFIFQFQPLLFPWWIAYLVSRKNKAIDINDSVNELWQSKGYGRLTIIACQRFMIWWWWLLAYIFTSTKNNIVNN